MVAWHVIKDYAREFVLRLSYIKRKIKGKNSKLG